MEAKVDEAELQNRVEGAGLVPVSLTSEIQLGERRFSLNSVVRTLRDALKKLFSCTDERNIQKILDPVSQEAIQEEQILRIPGGFQGLKDALALVVPEVTEGGLVEALNNVNVIPANHIDTHNEHGELCG